MTASKVIVRLSGGLGNQMFAYAAARRLANYNGADLVLDPWSGFIRDAVYRRQFALEPLAISGRLATSDEMLRPFERVRRAIIKRREASKPFEMRTYIAQDSDRFESRLLSKSVMGSTFLEGVWPSEDYFVDVSDQVRSDFRLRAGPHKRNVELARVMRWSNSIAVHVRFFKPDVSDTKSNVGAEFYAHAIATIRERTERAHFFIFSDCPAEAAQMLRLAPGTSTLVDHNSGDSAAHQDMWLMSQSRHAIIANSTFSWWGAWLGDGYGEGRIVIAPNPARYPAMGWSSERLLPVRWMKL